jgi:deoxyribodipyrimidine photo-lyase
MNTVPEMRIRTGNGNHLNSEGDYVLYWMTAFRRLGWNFALQHAAQLCRQLRKPLVILEILLADYPYASHRLHRFILDGMAERSRHLAGGPVTHYPFVERESGEARGLIPSLAAKACSVVVDDYPSFFLPRMVAEACEGVNARFELVDSNGLLPLAAADRTFTAAYHLRRFLQKELPNHLPELPDADPLADLPGGDPGEGDASSRSEGTGPGNPGGARAGPVDPEILQRWHPVNPHVLSGGVEALGGIGLDDSVPRVGYGGTAEEARRRLETLLQDRIQRYADHRNHPDLDATSGLSPFLHFGTISSHEIFAGIAAGEGWSPLRLSDRADGARAGWWGMGSGAEAFLDQLVTWRELGFNMTSREADYARYESLPEWARTTLEEHEGDPRPHVYSLEELRDARTHDPLWNAAQRQLLEEGVIHNYLRMLWGKKILQWTPSAREALDVMVELNDRLALDGRDPNSYSGIFWCLGRYDRGWPERPVFGKVRSMSSSRTRAKVRLDSYLDRFGA